jgi:hypothetical protein
LAPITADLVTGLVDGDLDRTSQALLAPCAPDRFTKEAVG